MLEIFRHKSHLVNTRLAKVLFVTANRIHQMLLCRLVKAIKVNCLFRVKSVWFLIADRDVLRVEKTLTVVDLTKPDPLLLLLLVSGDPNTQINVKLVVRQQHPAILRNELDGFDDVVDFCVAQVVRQVKPCESHTHHLMPFEKRILVLSR